MPKRTISKVSLFLLGVLDFKKNGKLIFLPRKNVSVPFIFWTEP